jgi:hypothetical protein
MSKDFNNRICPLCNKDYSEDDNYRRDDGSRLRALDTDAAEGQPVELESMEVADGKMS